MFRRIAVWSIETCVEALLFGAMLTLLLGHDRHAILKDALIYSSGIGLMFFSTGYLLSTIIARAAWKAPKPWLYSAVAVALFFIHFEIMSWNLGGAFDPVTRVRVRVAGACIVFGCTFVGTLVLRRWGGVGR